MLLNVKISLAALFILLCFISCNETDKKPLNTATKTTKDKGLVLIDTIVSKNKQWKLEWLSNGNLECTVKSEQLALSKSIKFDVLTENSIIEGFDNLIYKDEDDALRASVLYFFNDSVAIAAINDWHSITHFFYLKQDEKSIHIVPLEVDLTQLPGVIIANQLIIADEDEYKDDTTTVRYLFVYDLLSHYEGNNFEVLVKEEQYEIEAQNGGEYFFKYDNQAIYNFVTYHLSKGTKTMQRMD